MDSLPPLDEMLQKLHETKGSDLHLKVGSPPAFRIDGELHLSLAPRREDPRTTTAFRIVGAEPRQWDLLAPDGTTVEQTAAGLNVRVPLVEADLVFTPGSY